ncbi:Hypothetical protein FKW44_001534, partial [Caligus rogercresseyi]
EEGHKKDKQCPLEITKESEPPNQNIEILNEIPNDSNKELPERNPSVFEEPESSLPHKEP